MTELFTIPALKWEWFEETEIHGWRAEICGFGAMVYQELLRGVPPDWTVLASSQPTEFRASPEEGKQLAEKHWREYVKQALEPFAFTSSALRPVAQALYDKGCGHVMDVEEIEALLGQALAEHTSQPGEQNHEDRKGYGKAPVLYATAAIHKDGAKRG